VSIFKSICKQFYVLNNFIYKIHLADYQYIKHAECGFYVTANMVLNLAERAREIFESSEVDEKRELLNLVFQNLKLEGKKMLTEICEPFSTMIGYREGPTNWRWRELNSRPWQTTN